MGKIEILALINFKSKINIKTTTNMLKLSVQIQKTKINA